MANTIGFLKDKDFGPPLHTLVIPGNLHFMEVEALVKLAGLPGELKLGKKIQKL
jgi:diphthine synthase